MCKQVLQRVQGKGHKGEKAVEKVVKKGKSVCKKSEEALYSASELAKVKADGIVAKAKEVIKK